MHYRSLEACNDTIFITPNGIFRKQSYYQANSHYKKHCGSNVEGTVFFGSNFSISIFAYVNICIQGASLPQPRFSNFFSYVPAACNDTKGRSKSKEVVAQYVYLVSRVNQLRRTLGKTLNYRVNSRRSIVCRKSTSNTCERSSNTGQRVFAGSIEHIGSNRNNNNVTSIRTNVAQHTSQNNNWRKQELGSNGKQFFQTSVDVTGTISNTYTQCSNDYHA